MDDIKKTVTNLNVVKSEKKEDQELIFSPIFENGNMLWKNYDCEISFFWETILSYIHHIVMTSINLHRNECNFD